MDNINPCTTVLLLLTTVFVVHFKINVTNNRLDRINIEDYILNSFANLIGSSSQVLKWTFLSRALLLKTFSTVFSFGPCDPNYK